MSPLLLADLHTDVQNQFDSLLDAEAIGEDLPALFPELYAHLQTCAECWRAYAEFKAENGE